MSAPRTPRVVLLVEDDPDLRESVAEMLADYGYEVIPAANGADAIAVCEARRTRPSVIVLDLRMPVMDGFTFLERQPSMELLGDIPVIITTAELTGLTNRTPTVRAVVRKPFRVAALLPVIRDACEPDGDGG